jgi:hypothetical protein
MCQQIFVKLPAIKFHEHSSSVLMLLLYENRWLDRQTEIVKLIGTILQFFTGHTLKMEQSENTPLFQDQPKQISNNEVYLMVAID